jgi:hypothetical protein
VKSKAKKVAKHMKRKAKRSPAKKVKAKAAVKKFGKAKHAKAKQAKKVKRSAKAAAPSVLNVEGPMGMPVGIDVIK